MPLDTNTISRYHAPMKKKGKRKTVGIWISRPLHRKVKIEAAQRGTDMRALVEEAVSEYVGGSEDGENK